MAVTNPTLDCEEFNAYIEHQRQINQLQISIQELEDKTRVITEAFEMQILFKPENEVKIKIVFEPHPIHFGKKKKEQVTTLSFIIY